jgi:putative membrane protein
MNRTKDWIGWVIALLGGLINIAAMVIGLAGGKYEVNYGLTSILMFSYVACAYMFGIKKMLLMNVVSAISAFFFENLSVSFGFPFGFFNHFAAGPRVLNVPLQVGFGYYFYAFAGWVFADLLIGRKKTDIVSKIGRPLIGSFIASSMDLTTDAINGLVNGNYEYPLGGGFFGSPFSNSCGWIITTFVTLMLWELLILPRIRKNAKGENEIIGTASVWHLQNSILLGVQIIAPFIGFFIVKDTTIQDVLGNSWQVHYAYEASAMIALMALVFSMILGIFTWIRRKTEKY